MSTSASSASLEQPPSSVIQTGDVIDGKYLVGECIAWGGMGVVIDATHLLLQKQVALKCIRSEFLENEEMVTRFLNEARIAANLRNEHVARVLDFGKTEAGIPYLVMERLEGMSLAATVRERGPLPVTEAVDYILQACEALAEAHSQEIVHRDIKPENLFLTQGVNGTPIVKVLDFGISKQLSVSVGRVFTNPASSMGSPCYMSPEQMKNARLVDRRTDIWSMGAVLFELLTAEPPFDGDTLAEICAHVMCDAPASLNALRPDLPRGLQDVVNRCLRKDREKRFRDVAELARGLAKYASPSGRAGIPSIEHIASNPVEPPSGKRRRPVARWVAGFGPTLLDRRSAPRSSEPAQNDAPEPRMAFAGKPSHWGWALGVTVLLALAGVGVGAAKIFGHDVVPPLRGAVLPEVLRESAPDVPLAAPTLDLRFQAEQGPARALREPNAPNLTAIDPALSLPAPTSPAMTLSNAVPEPAQKRASARAPDDPNPPPEPAQKRAAQPASEDPFGL